MAETSLTIDGIVYLVDALDRERFPEAKKELDNLLTDDTLAQVPVLVLGGEAGAEDMRTCATALPTSLGPRTPPPISRPVLMPARRASITSRSARARARGGQFSGQPAD